MNQPQPLSPTPVQEVPLPRAPLACVIAQVRFPPILAIRDPDKVAVLQEELRETYPNLSRGHAYSVELSGSQPPNIGEELIWRLTDCEKDAPWRVSLGVDFVALDTSSYESRDDFLNRLRGVVSAVERAFNPASVSRLGLRYIDQLVGEPVDRINELIHPEILGIARSPESPASALGESLTHLMTEARFLAQDRVCVQGRWGKLPANVTYDPSVLEPAVEPSWVLDLDMFTTESQSFESDKLLVTATEFSKCIYWLFRQIVTEEFLRFYGGNS